MTLNTKRIALYHIYNYIRLTCGTLQNTAEWCRLTLEQWRTLEFLLISQNGNFRDTEAMSGFLNNRSYCYLQALVLRRCRGNAFNRKILFSPWILMSSVYSNVT